MLAAAGPSGEAQTPGAAPLRPGASAISDAGGPGRGGGNARSARRAASMKSRISPPGRPNSRVTPASRSVRASTSAHVVTSAGHLQGQPLRRVALRLLAQELDLVLAGGKPRQRQLELHDAGRVEG